MSFQIIIFCVIKIHISKADVYQNYYKNLSYITVNTMKADRLMLHKEIIVFSDRIHCVGECRVSER